MNCPVCSGEARVIDKSDVVPGLVTYRRYKCQSETCLIFFNTYEIWSKFLADLWESALKISSAFKTIGRLTKDKGVSFNDFNPTLTGLSPSPKKPPTTL